MRTRSAARRANTFDLVALDDDSIRNVLRRLDARSLRAVQATSVAVHTLVQPIFLETAWQSNLSLQLLLRAPEAPVEAVEARVRTEGSTKSVRFVLWQVSTEVATSMDQGLYEAAAQVQRKLVAAGRIISGARHPSTLTLIANLANTLSKLGRYAEAEAMQREELATIREVLGARHPSTLISMASFTDILIRVDRFGEAIPLARSALDERRVVLGAAHPATLRSVGRLVEAHCRAGAFAVARELLESLGLGADTLGVRVAELLGAQHPGSLEVAAQSTLLLAGEGGEEGGEGRERLRSLVGTMRLVLGNEHATTTWWSSTVNSLP